ncbi:uncharacterized protein LOC113030538 [Astatotilapia calliptera]|uniref:uncharacterized protein LOC113030538 n=1 Tax=Astatotilapia calliptera TaxID=8154 RepID=UPI000E4135B4|nr:uncharacterized protein LOC113030538 [Astatotilapia calliptera]
MALTKLLNNRPDTPYFRPPPLHIKILKSCDQLKVISWDFKDATPKPLMTKTNTIAAITDGQTVTKVTIFEAHASKVQQGGSFIMRGHELSGTGPPYNISVTPRTQFFRAPTLSVREGLVKQAEDLLHPLAPLTSLNMSSTNDGLMTVQGEVVEVSAVKKVLSGKEYVPLKNLQLKEDGFAMTICLWREAAANNFNVGDHISVSHVKHRQSSYGIHLQSTTFTKIETKVEERAEILIIGVATAEMPNHLEVLLEDGKTLYIQNELWSPFDKELEEAAIKVTVKIKGNHIVHIQKYQYE